MIGDLTTRLRSLRRGRGDGGDDGCTRTSSATDGVTGTTTGPDAAAGARPSRVSGPMALRIITVLVALVVIAAVVFLFVFPTAQWRDQRRQIDETGRQSAELARQITALEERIVDLQDPATVERIARERLGYARPDEESYRLQPPPLEAATFPPSWPWDGLERLVNGEG